MLLLSGTVCAILACSESTGTEEAPICGASTTLTATPGSSPTITWSPACRATRLLVTNADPNAIPCNIGFWFVGYPPDVAQLTSPLLYPEAPPSATIDLGCQSPLVVGDSITVTLYVPAPQLPDSVAVVAAQTFIQ